MKGKRSFAHFHRREYLAYCNAKYRCTNPRHKNYPIYGGRGIKFKFSSFEEFFEVVGSRPDGCVLDRINNDGHYESGNLRWVSPKTSIRNSKAGRPRTKFTKSGVSIVEEARRLGISYGALNHRLRRAAARMLLTAYE